MSVMICADCERYVDTDFEEGVYDAEDQFFCDNCAEKRKQREEDGT